MEDDKKDNELNTQEGASNEPAEVLELRVADEFSIGDSMG